MITAREAGGLGVPQQAADARGGVDDAFRGPAAELTVRTGQAEGQTIVLREVRGDLVLLDDQNDPSTVTTLRPGDLVDVDNSNFLAAQTYHRHQVPPEGYPVWDRFRDAAGKPVPPQRRQLLGPLFSFGAGGSVQTGKFSGKMIVVACLLDREAFPWQADWYRSAVRQHLGDALDEHFRLWYVDHALHGDHEVPEDPTRSVSYLGVLHQALRDLSAWVEQGTPPVASTGCMVTDGQVVVPSSAADRREFSPSSG